MDYEDIVQERENADTDYKMIYKDAHDDIDSKTIIMFDEWKEASKNTFQFYVNGVKVGVLKSSIYLPMLREVAGDAERGGNQ